MEPVFSLLVALNRGKTNYGEWVIACLEGAWSKLVGDRLAAACRPAVFRNSELVVEILNKSWEGAVRSVKPELLEKLQVATGGTIKAITIRIAG